MFDGDMYGDGDQSLRVDKKKLDITLTEIERGLKNEEAVEKAKVALLLTQVELRKSGNWTKQDYGWLELRQAVLDALRAIKTAQEFGKTPPTKGSNG
jgi:hypothetical protein